MARLHVVLWKWSLCGPLRSVNGLLARGNSLLVLRNSPPVLGTGLLALVDDLPEINNGAGMCSRRSCICKTLIQPTTSEAPLYIPWRCKIQKKKKQELASIQDLQKTLGATKAPHEAQHRSGEQDVAWRGDQPRPLAAGRAAHHNRKINKRHSQPIPDFLVKLREEWLLQRRLGQPRTRKDSAQPRRTRRRASRPFPSLPMRTA